jgi:hypothetical protein
MLMNTATRISKIASKTLIVLVFSKTSAEEKYRSKITKMNEKMKIIRRKVKREGEVRKGKEKRIIREHRKRKKGKFSLINDTYRARMVSVVCIFYTLSSKKKKNDGVLLFHSEC